MLETWLENRLLPRALKREASCSLTTLGMLTESSESAKGSMFQNHDSYQKTATKVVLEFHSWLGYNLGAVSKSKQS